MSNYIPPRGDYFYYIEIWDKATIRDSKISDIFGQKKVKPFYFSGPISSVIKMEFIFLTTFWKNKSTAENRIKIAQGREPDSIFKLKVINREEFIRLIPNKYDSVNSYINSVFKNNLKKKKEETTYKRKIENPWINYNKNLNDIFDKI